MKKIEILGNFTDNGSWDYSVVDICSQEIECIRLIENIEFAALILGILSMYCCFRLILSKETLFWNLKKERKNEIYYWVTIITLALNWCVWMSLFIIYWLQ